MTIGKYSDKESEWVIVRDQQNNEFRLKVKKVDAGLRLIVDDPNKNFKFIRTNALRNKELVKGFYDKDAKKNT